MQPRYQTVIFDLDGTLLESGPGVISGIGHALAHFNKDFPPGFDRRKVIGPPLKFSFMRYFEMAESMADQAVAVYRAYYDQQGFRMAAWYPGVQSLLSRLNLAGVKVCIATSKCQPVAEKVAGSFGIASQLFCLCGSRGTEMASTKKDIIQKVLDRCRCEPEKAVMIGDTGYDALGAAQAGVPFIGVLYGYGTREEMAGSGADLFVEKADDLGDLLFA